MKFRELKAEEIEVRVSRVTNAGVELLLYKTSRTDSDSRFRELAMQLRKHKRRAVLHCVDLER